MDLYGFVGNSTLTGQDFLGLAYEDWCICQFLKGLKEAGLQTLSGLNPLTMIEDLSTLKSAISSGSINTKDILLALGGDWVPLFNAIRDGDKKQICFYAGKLTPEIVAMVAGGGGIVAAIVLKIKKVRALKKVAGSGPDDVRSPQLQQQQGTRTVENKDAPETTPIPDTIYRGATAGNPNHVKLRPGEKAVSFRDSQSNAIVDGQVQPVLKPGRNYIGVDTKKLPEGSVVPDGGQIVDGVKMPPGHVSVKATPEQIIEATVEKGKYPKK